MVAFEHGLSPGDMRLLLSDDSAEVCRLALKQLALIRAHRQTQNSTVGFLLVREENEEG